MRVPCEWSRQTAIQPNQPQKQKHKSPNTPPKSSETPPNHTNDTAPHKHEQAHTHTTTHTHTHYQTTGLRGGHLRSGKYSKGQPDNIRGACVCYVSGAAKQSSNQTNHKSKNTRHQTHLQSHPKHHQTTPKTLLPTNTNKHIHSHTHTLTHTHNQTTGVVGEHLRPGESRRKTTEGGRACAMRVEQPNSHPTEPTTTFKNRRHPPLKSFKTPHHIQYHTLNQTTGVVGDDLHSGEFREDQQSQQCAM